MICMSDLRPNDVVIHRNILQTIFNDIIQDVYNILTSDVYLSIDNNRSISTSMELQCLNTTPYKRFHWVESIQHVTPYNYYQTHYKNLDNINIHFTPLKI
jgi:hypothetical protein